MTERNEAGHALHHTKFTLDGVPPQSHAPVMALPTGQESLQDGSRVPTASSQLPTTAHMSEG